MNMLMPNRIEPDSRVLVVAPQPFYEDRGTPIAIRHVLEALTASGHQVDLLTFPIGSGVDLPGMRIFRVGSWTGIKRVPIGFSLRKLFFDLLLCLSLLRMLRRPDYWCVHAVEEMVFPALVIARLRGIPVIYDMQSCLPDQLRGHPLLGLGWVQRLLVKCERWAFRKSSVVVGSAGLEPYVKRAEPGTRVCEWTFPGQENRASKSEIAARRAECGIPARAPIILYSGNFARYQGVNYLIDAIPEVLQAVPKAVFVLVGADERGIPADLRAAIDRVPAESLRILSRQPREALPSFIAMADILVSPRAGGDNLPLKMFDYIAAGKPIVATDYPIHRTILNEERAVLVEPNGQAMAQGLIRLLKDKALARSLGEAAREHSDAYYGLAAFQRLVRDIYWQVGGEPRVAVTHA